jgi:hypothetical protein
VEKKNQRKEQHAQLHIMPCFKSTCAETQQARQTHHDEEMKKDQRFHVLYACSQRLSCKKNETNQARQTHHDEEIGINVCRNSHTHDGITHCSEAGLVMHAATCPPATE